MGHSGKRIRASMVLIAAHMFSDDFSVAISQALGIEIFHNFTLLHDDIMDKAPLRRGMPTVHTKWNENIAILSGDAMMILANTFIANTKPEYISPVLETFNSTALAVCEGQQLDLNFEQRDSAVSPVSLSEYLEMIQLKTAVLLGASLKIGALCVGASSKNADILYNYGIQIGLAFQIQDDYLDTFGKQADFGKKIGGDIIEGKKTFLLVKAFENADNANISLLNNYCNNTDIDPQTKIDIVRNIYRETSADLEAEKAIESYFSKAHDLLSQLPLPTEKYTALAELEKLLIKRTK